MKASALNRLQAILKNNRVQINRFGEAPPYTGRVLVISLWWNDDHCKFLHLTLRRELMMYRISRSLFRVRFDGRSSRRVFTSYASAESYLSEARYWGALPEEIGK